MAIEHDITVAVDKRGRTTPLGEFVFRFAEDKNIPISQLSRDSNLSRSFLYLLKDDRQVPSLDSLVALFEAMGIGVRPAEPGEPGELAIEVDGKPYWIRFPSSHRRTDRSRTTLQSFAASGSWADEEPTLMAAAPQASYSRSAGSGYTRSPRNDERQRLLSELLSAAGELDKERLRLLIDHARLLGRG